LREAAEAGADVSLHRCWRHPSTVPLQGHCPVCLLEAALTSPEPAEMTVGSFTIQVPLGESEAASVFVVREDAAAPRLLRLKQWHTPAPAGFMDGFEGLRVQLQEWRPPAVVLPLTAWVDTKGRPSVITDFRQGMPLLESVRSGWLHPDRARSGLRQLQELLDAAHHRGLAHGSVVPNNVFSSRPDGALYLLDFGFAALLSDPGAPGAWAAADDEGLVRIQSHLQQLGCGPP
jgi:serine/threonine protein kinase